MRDYSVLNGVPADASYKEVVVIGNGPSGIALSYLLDGHWPYYTGSAHPDKLLTARLNAAASSRSLVQQDLRFLAQGLEGRTNNPVSLLMDTLHHPCADLGLDLPSLLQWRHHPDRQVDHIVLGKGPPGGAWQAMDGNVLTISLGSWMSLPGVDYRAWDKSETARDSRASSASVAHYYADYVRTQGLGRYFRNGCVVTSVRLVDAQHCWECTDAIDPETGVPCGSPPRWLVQGYDTTTSATFSYLCSKVVLATGACDLPNRLGVPGELDDHEWVTHDLRQLELAMDELVEREDGDEETPIEASCDPILIVGAGLSAADAVIAARFRSLPIIHLFRKRVTGLEKQLPENMYPEYHKVHQMMSDGGVNYPRYTALPEHKILEITANRKVRILCPDGTTIVHRVSLAAILIGSRPDLSFLSENTRLGLTPTDPIDCRSNPIDLDPFTYEVTNAPPGMHALGPLAGDNFVRFIQGGAVAITSHIHKERKLRAIT